MAQIWIQGKLVTITDPEELLRFLPLADATPPDPEAAPPETRGGGGRRLKGFFGKADNATKAVLRALAEVHPKNLPAADLRKRIPEGDPRDLRGVMSTISKKLGKGKAVLTENERKGKERVFTYRLSDQMLIVAKGEGWAVPPA